MKLYFYFLEDSGIRTEECEVEEKNKTYAIVGKSPRGFYNSRVNKENIGVISGSYTKIVIFTEPNFEKAKDIFHKYLIEIIQG